MHRRLLALTALTILCIAACDDEPKSTDEQQLADAEDRFVQELEVPADKSKQPETPPTPRPSTPPKEARPAPEEAVTARAERDAARAKKRKRELKQEAIENKSILGQIGAAPEPSSGGLADTLSEGAGRVRGAGGMGMRGTGTGTGGGGEGYGRVSGLGKVDTGGGKAVSGKSAFHQVPRVAEPESNTEGYEDHGTNARTPTAKDRFSTFAIDVDTGSYTIARCKLKDRHLPPPASVRVEEFVNYFDYAYPNPDRGAFGVSLEAAPSPFSTDSNRKLLRVGVQGKRVSEAEREPVHLTFLVDVSGSMNRPDKIGLAKRSLEILTNNLQKGDTVALATYAGANRLVLPATGMAERATILAAIEDLTSGGGTAMSSGMDLAYKQAIATRRTGHVNRVIVLSDGDANIGPSSHGEILKRIQSYVDEGITLSTIGFGQGNYKDTMMEQLANKGNGNYYYIDSEREARKVFGEQLDGTLEVIAKDVKIQVEFNPEAVTHYRLIGYENRDIADEDFRDDTVDAGEIGAGHSVTAFYEVDMATAPASTLATVRIRAKKPDGHTAAEQAFVMQTGEVRAKLPDASKGFQFGAAVVAAAELLRESPYADHVSWALVEEVAKVAVEGRAPRREFVDLVGKARRL